MKQFVRSAARRDIQRQFEYYVWDCGSEEAGERFLDSVEQGLSLIRKNPAIGSPKAFQNLAGLRSWPVPGFEEVRIYYMVTAVTL